MKGRRAGKSSGLLLVPQALGPCFSQELEGIWHLNSLESDATGSLGIGTLIAATDPTWHWGKTNFPSFFSHHHFSVVLFLVERALCCSDEGKKNKGRNFLPEFLLWAEK